MLTDISYHNSSRENESIEDTRLPESLEKIGEKMGYDFGEEGDGKIPSSSQKQSPYLPAEYVI